MMTFASLCLGCVAFLSFCVMVTAGLARVVLVGKDSFERNTLINGIASLGQSVVSAEEGTEELWPQYGTGPPAKGP